MRVQYLAVILLVCFLLTTVVFSQQTQCACSNERPPSTPDYDCVKLAKWGKCERPYLEGYCNASCQRCNCPCADKLPNDGGASCEKRAEWGACEKGWMIEGFYCAKTCGFCQTSLGNLAINPSTNSSTAISPSWNSISSLMPGFTPPSQTLPAAPAIPQPAPVLMPAPTLATSLINTQPPQQLPVTTPSAPATKQEGQSVNVAQAGIPFELEEPAIVPSPLAPASGILTTTVPSSVVPVAPSVLPAPATVGAGLVTPTQTSMLPAPAIVGAELATPTRTSMLPAPVTATTLPTPTQTPVVIPTSVVVPSPVPIPSSLIASNVVPTVGAPAVVQNAEPVAAPLVPDVVTATNAPAQEVVDIAMPLATVLPTSTGPLPAFSNSVLNAITGATPVVTQTSSTVPAQVPAQVPAVEEVLQEEALLMAVGYDSISQNYESIGSYSDIIQDALNSDIIQDAISQVVSTQQVDATTQNIATAVVDPTAPLSATLPATPTLATPIAAADAVAGSQVIPTPLPLTLPAPAASVPTPPQAAAAPGTCNTVYDIMSTDPDLSTSFKIWNAVKDMKSEGYDDPSIPFTIFVPVNAAWANYTFEQSKSLDELLADLPLLNRLVTFHELPEPTLSTTWRHGLNLRSELRDIYNKRIIVLVGMPEGLDGEVRLLAQSQALVIERDIPACAAVLMKLGDIMVPSGARLPPLQPSAVN